MLEKIIEGEFPSVVFKQMLERTPTLTNYDLAFLLFEKYPRLNGDVLQVVWQWERPGELKGIPDENLDGFLREHLLRAKYI